MSYTPKQFQTLVDMKAKIIGSHKKCEGTGYLKGYTKCQCMKVFEYVKDLVRCGIPSDYWELTMNELSVLPSYKKIVSEYMKNLDNAISQGLGMMFLGDRGIGKTSLQCEIGKYAITQRYEVCYELMQNIVNDKYTDDQLIRDKIKSADIILIDEFEKVMMRAESNIPKQIDTFFREILPNKKSVIINTNMSEEELDTKFGLGSLLKRYVKYIQMDGDDFSEHKQDKWFEKLQSVDVNYFNKNIVSMAEIFYSNEQKANEREFNTLRI